MTVAMLQGKPLMQKRRNIGSQTRFQLRDPSPLSTILQKCAMDVDDLFGGWEKVRGQCTLRRPLEESADKTRHKKKASKTKNWESVKKHIRQTKTPPPSASTSTLPVKHECLPRFCDGRVCSSRFFFRAWILGRFLVSLWAWSRPHGETHLQPLSWCWWQGKDCCTPLKQHLQSKTLFMKKWSKHMESATRLCQPWQSKQKSKMKCSPYWKNLSKRILGVDDNINHSLSTCMFLQPNLKKDLNFSTNQHNANVTWHDAKSVRFWFDLKGSP